MASEDPPPSRTVQNVVLGTIRFQTWYPSIYPEDLVNKDTDTLFVCRWCFRYACDINAHAGHKRVCQHRTVPPGNKVYDQGGYSVWEVDGANHKLFGQNLSLFAKLFLDHKSVFFDVVSFLYYILVFTDPDDPDGSYHILGFFSKEKLSWDANNLACILVFPPYQHKQLGKLLMGVSYKISGWERDASLIGGPERPLSEMGGRSYGRFWEERIARHLLLALKAKANTDTNTVGESEDVKHQQGKSASNKSSRKKQSHELMTVQEIGFATGMLTEDVITTLRALGVTETASPSKTRKKTQHGESQALVIRRSKVLEWAKARNINIRDPVREDGFYLSQILADGAGARKMESPGSDDDD